VKIDLSSGPKGSSLSLRSGLFGKARFPSGQRRVIAIPQGAVIQRGQLLEVFVVDPKNTAHLRLVKTGKQYGERVEVLSGLREGERIVVEGVERLSDGSRIISSEE
jgi:multidrug efflux pump subunit AcrA (membrane-fusion protein)